VTPGFAATMVAKYEALLMQAAGIGSTTVDGATVTLADLEAKYNYWRKIAQRESGTRPRVARINLGNSF
jgi:hypothetical protein